MHIADIVPRSAQFWPDHVAVVDEKRSLSYAELDRRSNRLANGLASRGLVPGDRIAFFAWNCAEIVEAEIAFYKGGYVKVPMNARLSPKEAVMSLVDSQTSAIIVDEQHLDILSEIRDEYEFPKGVYIIDKSGDDGFEGLIEQGDAALPEVDRDNNTLAVLHYTSGSSGVLKAAMQTFGNRLEGLRKYALFSGTRMEVGEIRAHVGPMTHATGKFVLPTLFFGGCVRIFSKFDAAALAKAIQDEGIAHLFLVPTMLNLLVNVESVEKYDFSSLRSIVYGGSAASPALLEKAIRLFGPILNQLYGAGEVTGGVTVLTGSDHAKALSGNKDLFASCGRNIGFSDVLILNEDGRQVNVGEIGEVVIRGRDVMQGYWRSPELTAECLKDGAYYTGDMAKMDKNGYVYIVDRKKDMIITGGFNVYSSEVENVLMQHPAIFEAAVIGVPDEKWGESIKAVVTPKPEATVTEAELINYCAEHLARFKKPASIDFMDEIPKNKNGKIHKKSLKDRYWQGYERRVG